MKPTLYILCGYPFSGKTTLCKAIVRYFGNTVHFCIDEFFQSHPELIEEEEKWDVVFQHGRDLTCSALKEGKDVLFDATNYLKKERAKLTNMAEKCEGQSAVIYVEIPIHVARQRLMDNRKSNLRSDVEEAAWEEVTGDFEVPIAEENVIIYQGEVDVEEWVGLFWDVRQAGNNK